MNKTFIYHYLIYYSPVLETTWFKKKGLTPSIALQTCLRFYGLQPPFPLKTYPEEHCLSYHKPFPQCLDNAQPTNDGFLPLLLTPESECIFC